jgi:hypothetical protein
VAISGDKEIDPVPPQHIITDHDPAHHVREPINAKDLTRSDAPSSKTPPLNPGPANAALGAGRPDATPSYGELA